MWRHTRIVFERSKAHGADRLVLLVIADRLNRRTGNCWPGQELVAKEAGVSLRQVRRSIKNLKALGELEWERRGRRNVYHLTVHIFPKSKPMTEDVLSLLGDNPSSNRGHPVPGNEKEWDRNKNDPLRQEPGKSEPIENPTPDSASGIAEPSPNGHREPTPEELDGVLADLEL